MRNIKQDVERVAKSIGDIGQTIDGLDLASSATGAGFQRLAQAIKGLSNEEKKKSTVKGGWLLTQAFTRGNYPNLIALRDQCAKQPPSSRKKRVDGKRNYPDENRLALGVINAAGIFKVAEELEPETEALYMSRVMDLLDIWEGRYLVDDGQGNVKALSDDERKQIDEEIFNDIDTAVYDPMQDRVQALWIQLKDKGHEFDADLQEWAERPSEIEGRLQNRLDNREERKSWKLGERLKWALGFRKNL